VADPATPLARSRIHRALSRPNLLMGADRELVLLTGLAAAISAFVVLTWFSVLFGIVIWIGVVAALRMMAKADPMMRQVYVRHIRFRPASRAHRARL
jgi:type IV secretory pathway TrbD component